MEKLQEFLKKCPPNILILIYSFNVNHRKNLENVHNKMDEKLFKHWLKVIPTYPNTNEVIQSYNYYNARNFCLHTIPTNKICKFSQFLFECNCCKRHQYRKSYISKKGFSSVKHKKGNFRYTMSPENCTCQCRHLGRMLGNVFIHEIMDINSDIYK